MIIKFPQVRTSWNLIMFGGNNNRNYTEFKQGSQMKRNINTYKKVINPIMENINDDSDIDDSLVNFGISDESIDLLLIDVTNGKNPALAAKVATEGVDQKGMANLITRILAIAIKDESLIKAAFDIVTAMVEIPGLPSALPGENPSLVTCLRNLEKMCMSGDDWENLPEMLTGGYIRLRERHCVAEILIKWLVFPSWENDENKLIIGRQVKNTSVLLSKVGKRLLTDLPGRFVQIHQMAKKHLLSELCHQRSELLEIVISMSSLNHPNIEVVNKTENEDKIEAPTVYHGQVGSNTNLVSDDYDTDMEEMFSLADLGSFKEKEESEESNSQKKCRLISPSQFEARIAIHFDEQIDKLQELSFNPSCSKYINEAKYKAELVDETDAKSSKNENKTYSKLEVDMAKLRLTSGVNTSPESANDMLHKTSLLPDISNHSENVKYTPQAQQNNGAGELTSLKRLGYLETIDNPKTGEVSLTPKHTVNDGCCVGRMPSCQVTISGPKVSRVHAEIYKQDDAIFLQTVSKTNGCRVNMESVGAGKSIRIKTGDTIEIGSVPFVWLEDIANNKNEEELNKVYNIETQEIPCKTLESNLKDVNEEIYKKNQKVTRKRGMKNKPNKSNVASVLEANAKKIKKSPASQYISRAFKHIPKPVNKLQLAGTPRPDKENHEQKNKFLPGKQFTFGSSQIKSNSNCPLPNLTIPPPNFGIQTQEMEEDNPQRDCPKVPSQFCFGETEIINCLPPKGNPPKLTAAPLPNVSTQPPNIGIHTLNVKKEISQRKGPKVFRFPPGKERSSVPGQFDDFKKQENDDVVIESERFL